MEACVMNQLFHDMLTMYSCPPTQLTLHSHWQLAPVTPNSTHLY